VENLELNLLDILEKVTQKIAPGPSPSFNEAHVVKALEIIGDYGSIGRIRLSNELGLGEGTTRTILKHLKNEGILQSSRRGISLSEAGKELFSDLRSKLSAGVEVPSSSLTVGSVSIGILVRNAANAVRSGMEQRDMAIKSGATGATTLIYSGNKLSLPTREERISETMPKLHDKLVAQFKPKENDVIIVGCGENSEVAEIGAKMAAIKLLKNNK
jgi:predicted transcriptional regulator